MFRFLRCFFVDCLLRLFRRELFLKSSKVFEKNLKNRKNNVNNGKKACKSRVFAKEKI